MKTGLPPLIHPHLSTFRFQSVYLYLLTFQTIPDGLYLSPADLASITIQTKYIMKKLSILALAALMFGGIAFLTGCGEKNEADTAAEATEDAGENTADAMKDAGEKAADALKDATN